MACSLQVKLISALVFVFLAPHYGRTQTVPGQPVVVIDSITATSVSLSWSIPSGSTQVDEYTIQWSSTDCPGQVPVSDAQVGGETTSYTLADLEEYITYSISVTAINEDGSTISSPVSARTSAAAPSGAPVSVTASVGSTYIYVYWQDADCIHRNGEITGYSVRYGEVGSSESDKIVQMIPGPNIVISGVTVYTDYTIEVATVNSAGVGVYSDPFTIYFDASPAVYFSLHGNIIPNHGYVIIDDIGYDGDDNTSLLCHTNRPPPRIHSGGEWFTPDGTRVAGLHSDLGLRKNRGPMVVRLFKNDFNPEPPTEGIYYCQILDATETLHTMYIGLYYDGGDVTVNNDGVLLTVDSDPIGASPQFTLTCISTGGPATNVTWTRDSVTVTVGTETVLENTTTALYTHTLNVTGRLGGLYTCTVANDRPSSDSASITVEVAPTPIEVMAVQEGLTSIRVSWSAPYIPSNTSITGYIVQYTGGDSSENVSLFSTAESYLVTGLNTGDMYTISVVSTSKHISSAAVMQEVTLVLFPGKPMIAIASRTATAISLWWSVPSGSVVDSSTMTWQAFSSDGTLQTEESGTTGLINYQNYTLNTPRSCILYALTVTLSNQAGNTSQSIIVSTVSCSTGPESSTSDSSTSAVGGTMTVILILTAAVMGVVIALLVLKNRQLKKPSSSHSYNLQKVDNLELQAIYRTTTPETIPTSSNNAYRVVTKEAMAGGDCQEAEYEGVDADSPLTSSPHKTAPAVPQEETEYEGIESLPTSSPIQAPAPSTSPGATNHDSDPLEGDTLYEPV